MVPSLTLSLTHTTASLQVWSSFQHQIIMCANGVIVNLLNRRLQSHTDNLPQDTSGYNPHLLHTCKLNHTLPPSVHISVCGIIFLLYSFVEFTTHNLEPLRFSRVRVIPTWNCGAIEGIETFYYYPVFPVFIHLCNFLIYLFRPQFTGKVRRTWIKGYGICMIKNCGFIWFSSIYSIKFSL